MTKFTQLRSLLQPLPAAALVLLGAAVTLAGAWTFQSLGFEPCELCLKQRYPYYAALPLATAAIFLARNAPPITARLVLALLAVIFIASAVAGGYHAGVEWKFWPGPADCSGPINSLGSANDMLKRLQNIRIVRCDEAAWRFLGISLAGYDVLVSLFLAAVAAWGFKESLAQQRRSR
jgi:disulfide bond formation protein DsbB